MSSQLPLKADIAQYGRHFAFVPNSDIDTLSIRMVRRGRLARPLLIIVLSEPNRVHVEFVSSDPASFERRLTSFEAFKFLGIFGFQSWLDQRLVPHLCGTGRRYGRATLESESVNRPYSTGPV
jgi:hypothetical protein